MRRLGGMEVSGKRQFSVEDREQQNRQADRIGILSASESFAWKEASNELV